MLFSTLTDKGQVTIPKSIRERLHLRPGDKMNIRVEADGTLRVIPKSLSVAEVAGLLSARTSAPMSIEDMDQAIVETLTKKHRP